MRKRNLLLVSVLGLSVALGAGFALGLSAGKRSSETQEMMALTFSGEHSRLAFAEADASSATDALTRHRAEVEKSAAILGATGRDLELMLVDARLAALARELGRSDATPMAAALAACKRLRKGDCTPDRINALAGPRSGAARQAP